MMTPFFFFSSFFSFFFLLKGRAFVEFADADEVRQALGFNRMHLGK